MRRSGTVNQMSRGRFSPLSAPCDRKLRKHHTDGGPGDDTGSTAHFAEQPTSLIRGSACLLASYVLTPGRRTLSGRFRCSLSLLGTPDRAILWRVSRPFLRIPCVSGTPKSFPRQRRAWSWRTVRGVQSLDQRGPLLRTISICQAA